MTDKKTEALKLALKKAFDLGQRYWQQADSDFTSQWRKADVTLASFNQLVEDTIREALAEQPESKPWLGLTDDDIESAMPGGIYDCLADPWDCNVGDGDYMRSIKKDVLRVARSAIAAYEEKNGITGEKA